MGATGDRGNLRILLAAVVGAVVAVVVGLPFAGAPPVALIAGCVTVGTIGLVFGGAALWMMQNPPDFIVQNAMDGIEDLRASNESLKTWTAPGAAVFGVLAVVTALVVLIGFAP